MTTKKQLAALAKGREKLAKSRKLNGLKDLFKSKSEKSPVKKQETPKAKKTSKKTTAQAKKAVRKELTETKKKVRKTTSKIFSNARKKAVKETNKALASTKKRLQKKGLAGNDWSVCYVKVRNYETGDVDTIEVDTKASNLTDVIEKAVKQVKATLKKEGKGRFITEVRISKAAIF